MADDTAAAAAATAAVDDARAKAEARRQRILDKANTRMGVVSGEMALGDGEKKQSTTSAARIRAARQRRYGKKTQRDTTTSQKDEKVEDNQKDVGGQEDSIKDKSISEKQEVAPGTTDPASEKKKDDLETSKTTEEPKIEEVAAVESKTEAKPTIAADGKKVDETTATKETSKIPEGDSSKKKYMGVARMRRKKMLEQKAREEQQSQTASVESSEATSDAVATEVVKPVVSSAKVVPIFMYTLTILLLFLAGFDFGWQQYHGQVIVHRELAAKDFPSRFNKVDPDPSSGIESLTESNSFSKKKSKPSIQEKDEFEDEPIVEEEAKIDPLFGVDLDELTKGPGVIMFFARCAVAAHRFLLLLFYFGPRNFISSIFELPKALMETPPMLGIIAVLVRQVIGKGILRAEIPSPQGDDKDASFDVLSMVKNGVTNFLKSAFPMAASFYTAFFDLRSDMYIIIFGAMCGMIWSDTMARLAADDVDGAAAEL